MIEELEDRWTLGLRGTQVLAVAQESHPSACTVTLAGGVDLTVNGPVRLTRGPVTAPGVAPNQQLDELVGATVLSSVAFKSGVLRIVFSTGHHLNVRGDKPEVAVQIRKPGDFDYSYRGGDGAMKVLGSNAP